MASFLQSLGNIGQVANQADLTYAAIQDRQRKQQEAQQAAKLRALQIQEATQKISEQQQQKQGTGMAWQALQAMNGGAGSPPNPQAPGQPSVPMAPLGAPSPQGSPQQISPGGPQGGGQPSPPPGAGAPAQPPQTPPPGGTQPNLAPALTGAGGLPLPASFNVEQAMSYLQKQNPEADPVTLFSALGQMGGMWDQLHPQAKQDYMLLRDNIKAQMQMEMLESRLKATDEQIDRRGELQKTRDAILEAGRNSRFQQGEAGKDSRQDSRETGIQDRFNKRQEAAAGKAATAASLKEISDQKTEAKDQITKLNRERSAIKAKYSFGQPPHGSDDEKKLQETAQQVDQLSDKIVQLDRSIRSTRSGGSKPVSPTPIELKEKDNKPGVTHDNPLIPKTQADIDNAPPGTFIQTPSGVMQK